MHRDVSWELYLIDGGEATRRVGTERSASPCMSEKLSGEAGATRRSLRDHINLQPSRRTQLPTSQVYLHRDLSEGGK